MLVRTPWIELVLDGTTKNLENGPIIMTPSQTKTDTTKKQQANSNAKEGVVFDLGLR